MQPGYILKRTNSDDADFKTLVAALDEELRIRDGENHAFYAALNKTAFLPNAIVVYENDTAVGCGAFRSYDEKTMELKRMYVQPRKRGGGIATIILHSLEKWCNDSGIEKIVLETGKNQPEAIALYQKHGYKMIPAYGKYIGAENSVCFEKIVKQLNPL